MRTRLALAGAALLAALPSAAAAAQFVVPTVTRGSCDLEVRNGTARCLVQLDPNQSAIFGQVTNSGYGIATLYCHVSGHRDRIEGDYGTEVHNWSHGFEVCDLTLYASGGTSSAYVD